MKQNTRAEGGFLTIWSIDRDEIIGELTDATWVEEQSESGSNHVLSGNASDGTLDTVLRLIQSGVASVAYELAVADKVYSGKAMLLQPTESRAGAGATVSIESPDAPRQATSSPAAGLKMM